MRSPETSTVPLHEEEHHHHQSSVIKLLKKLRGVSSREALQLSKIYRRQGKGRRSQLKKVPSTSTLDSPKENTMIDLQKLQGKIERTHQKLQQESHNGISETAAQQPAVADAVNSGIALCGHFKDMVEALGDYLPKSTAVQATKLARHAPVIGLAFELLLPTLEGLAQDEKVDEQITRTFTRISKLAESLAKHLRRFEKRGRGRRFLRSRKTKILNRKLDENVHKILQLIGGGLECINTIQSSKNQKRRFGGDQPGEWLNKLKGFNDEIDEEMADMGNAAAAITIPKKLDCLADDLVVLRHCVIAIPVLTTLALASLLWLL